MHIEGDPARAINGWVQSIPMTERPTPNVLEVRVFRHQPSAVREAVFAFHEAHDLRNAAGLILLCNSAEGLSVLVLYSRQQLQELLEQDARQWKDDHRRVLVGEVRGSALPPVSPLSIVRIGGEIARVLVALSEASAGFATSEVSVRRATAGDLGAN